MINNTLDFNDILRKIKSHPLPSLSKSLDDVIDILGIEEIKTIRFKNRTDFNKEMYIHDIGFYVNRYDNTVWVSYLTNFNEYQTKYNSLPKYHLYNTCDTKASPELYTFTSENTGLFSGDSNTRTESLAVCKKCLEKYNREFNENFTVYNFSLADFMAKVNMYLSHKQ